MTRRRNRRRNEKQQRRTPLPVGPLPQRAIVREAERVERLAYTRSQAAEALGISTSTFNRRLLPFIDTVKMPWGRRLIPVDELERLLTAQRQSAREQAGRPSPTGRRPGLPADVIMRIRHQHAAGHSLAAIARSLNSDSVQTSQGSRQWWPSTVRAVLDRPRPAKTAQAIPDS